MAQLKFKLELTIEGHTLDEIDNGLAEAAGQRILARIQSKTNEGILPKGVVLERGAQLPTPNTIQPMVTLTPAAVQAVKAVEEVQAAVKKVEGDEWEKEVASRQSELHLPARKKPGRPKGWKLSDQKNKKDHKKESKEAPESNQSKSENAIVEEDTTSFTSKESEVKKVDTTPQEIPSQEKVLEVLSAVTKKFSLDKGRECLIQFGAQRARELADEKKAHFVQYCQELIASG